MPVTFKIAPHDANEVGVFGLRKVETTEDILKNTWQGTTTSSSFDPATQVTTIKYRKCQELLQSSLDPGRDLSTFASLSNGFVRSIITAYSTHHNVIIRPDDIWLAILCQFNLYVNAHSEELRSTFVAHEGKRELEIVAVGTRYTVDFAALSNQMSAMIKKNIVDETFHDFVMPTFTTTTPNDVTIASVTMMSTLKAYFSYKMSLRCGIPNITILGEKSDYENILSRLDRFKEFGAEPTAFAALLRPILRNFIQAFDTPDLNFWSRICHESGGGSGPTWLGGWIAAFCVWDSKGKWQGTPLDKLHKPATQQENQYSHTRPLIIDNVRYPRIDIQDVPNGYCDVDVKLDDNGALFDCIMVAGHVGMNLSAAGESLEPNTVQPASEWFIFVKEDVTEIRDSRW